MSISTGGSSNCSHCTHDTYWYHYHCFHRHCHDYFRRCNHRTS